MLIGCAGAVCRGDYDALGNPKTQLRKQFCRLSFGHVRPFETARIAQPHATKISAAQICVFKLAVLQICIAKRAVVENGFAKVA